MGNFEQPQNLFPALAPVFAVLRIIGLPHFGQTGASSLADSNPGTVVVTGTDGGSIASGFAAGEADEAVKPGK